MMVLLSGASEGSPREAGVPWGEREHSGDPALAKTLRVGDRVGKLHVPVVGRPEV